MKYILVILSLCLLTIPAQAGTLKYDFNDGNLNNWEFGGLKGQWQIENGELSGEFKGFPSSDLVTVNKDFGNYTMECRAKIIEAFPVGNDITWAGIVVRYSDTMNTYVFGLDLLKQQAYFEFDQGVQMAWLNFPFAVEKNKYYKFKAIAEGDHLQFFIDDVLIHDFRDKTFAFGKVGVFVIHAHAHFDDVIITGGDVLDNNNAVTHQGKLATSWGQMKSR